MKKKINRYFVLVSLYTQASYGSGGAGGYLLLGLLFSIPSFMLISLMIFFVVKQSKKENYIPIKIGVITFSILVPCGICFSPFGPLVPNFIALQEGYYKQPILYSILITFMIMFFYKKQWNKNNKDLIGNK